MVDVAKINDWLQVVGIFGVIASLVFVGLQMKQTQDIALAGTYNARASQTIENECFHIWYTAAFCSSGQNVLRTA
jgi:hypothetical protein